MRKRGVKKLALYKNMQKSETATRAVAAIVERRAKRPPPSKLSGLVAEYIRRIENSGA